MGGRRGKGTWREENREGRKWEEERKMEEGRRRKEEGVYRDIVTMSYTHVHFTCVRIIF